MSSNSFSARATFKVGNKEYELYRLDALDKQGISTKHLPFSLRILLENLLRTEDGRNVTKEEIRALAAWNKNSKPEKEIAFTPSRVLLQDFTGEILQQNAAGSEGDFLFRLRIFVPRRERANFFLSHVAPVFSAQQILQQNAQRKRQVFRRDALLVESVEPVELVFFVADLESCAGAKTIRYHDGLPSQAPAQDRN